jgi:hypothetical protein
MHDDNFLIPANIEECIAFLNGHADYSAARGLGVSVKTKGDQPFGKLTMCVKKEQPSSECETASLRLQSLYGNYSDIRYAVHRTEIYKEVLKNSRKLNPMPIEIVRPGSLPRTCYDALISSARFIFVRLPLSRR